MSNKTGILQFNIEDPQALSDMKLALNAPSLGCAITEYDNVLRNKSKYEDKETITIEEARSLLTELINEYYPGFYDDYR